MKNFSEDRFPYKYLLYFFAVTLIISIAGYMFYLDRKIAIEQELYRHVVAIKEIKLQQIEKEQLQRKSVIQSFIKMQEIDDDLNNLFLGKNIGTVKNKISDWAVGLRKDFDFISINIFNKNAELLFSTDTSKSIFQNFLKHELKIILQKDTSSLTNLYLDVNRNLLQAIITPVKKSGKVTGFVWTEVSFFEYLYPIIAYSKQEPGDIEYILLKSKSDFGFILKDIKVNNEFVIQTLPLSKRDKSEIESLVDKRGFNRGTEIKGTKVIASVNDIPGTDWVLIAKIVQDKVTESTKITALIIAIITILLIGLSASITYAIWKRSYIQFLIRTFKLRKEKDALNERYTSLTRYANDIILSLEKDGQILEVNQKAVDTYGYNKDELLKMNLLDLCMERKKDVEIIFSSINTREGILYETNHKRKNGTIIPVEISAKLIQQGDIEILLAIIRDNTERKKLELDLILAKDKAEEMDRLKTIFLSNMSHELNTPMSGIMGFSELLLQDLEDKNQRDMAMYIHKSSKRLNETLTSLLDISKIQAQNLDIKFIPVDIVGTLKECRLIYSEPAIAKGLIINFSSSMEKIIIKGDSNILHKIICNLLDNAVKYTKHGEINLNAETKNNTALITISDTGIGISEDHIRIIFEPFRQASEGLTRKYEGSGLGLSITKKYVELLKGKINIASQLDVGTTLTLEFPLLKN